MPDQAEHPPLRGAALAYAVLDHIDAHPEQWDQTVWSYEAACGTVACFAGWTIHLAYGRIEVDDLPDGISDRAAQLLGFNNRNAMDTVTDAAGEANWLFCSSNDREDIGRMVRILFGDRP